MVAAARARFAEAGFDGTTGAAIAADAGVSEPTIAFHFGGKAGLLVAVMREYYDDLLVEMEQVMDAAEGPAARLQAFARWWVARNDAHADLMAVFGRQGRGPEPDEVVEAFLELNRAVTRRFDRLIGDLQHAGLLGQAVPRTVVRDAFFGGAEHMMIGRRLTGRPTDLDAAADHLVALLVGGAGGGAPGGGGGQGGGSAGVVGGGPGGPTDPGVAALEAKLDRVLDLLDPARDRDGGAERADSPPSPSS